MSSSDPRTIAEEARTVAVVGASDDPSKYSNEVARYLRKHGKHVIPVNPHDEEVLGKLAYSRVDEIPEQVDVVDVFLHPEQTPEIAEEAVKIKAKVLWLQEGIENPETRRIAEEGGLAFVENRCMLKALEGLR